MTVYYDLVFLVNMIYQLGILCFTNRILRYGRPLIKLVTAALIQCFLFLVITVFTFQKQQAAGWILNMTGSFFVSAVLFRANTFPKILRLLMTESVLCILLGGILTLLHTYTDNGYLLLTGAGSLVFLGLFVRSIKELFSQAVDRKHCLYDVRILHREREFCIKGLLDSGNGLTDPISGEPVCILTHDLCDRLLMEETPGNQSGYRLIPYHTIGKKNGLMEAFFVDSMEFRQTSKETALFSGQKILCAVCPDNFSEGADYEIILHPRLFS